MTNGQVERLVYLTVRDSLGHVGIQGATGAGKTTTEARMFLADVAAGRGAGILEAKDSELCRAVLARFDRRAFDKLVYISPHERSWSVGFNPLQVPEGEDPNLVAEHCVAVLKSVFAPNFGIRSEEAMRAVALTLSRFPGATLAMVGPLLTDPSFRAHVLAQVESSDPLGLGGYWRFYDRWSDSQRTEIILPLLNRLNGLLNLPAVRRLLCQESTFSFDWLVNEGGILVADLAPGAWGPASAKLIGGLLFAHINQAIRRRAAVPEEERPVWSLYMDEFAPLVEFDHDFSRTLVTARSYHLALTLAWQQLGQLSPEIRSAVASNCRTLMVHAPAPEDAAYFAKVFPPLGPADLSGLGHYEVAMRLSIGGHPSGAFTGRTLPLPEPTDPTVAADAVARAAAHFGRSVEQIDRDLAASMAGPQVLAPEHGPGRRGRG